MVRVFFLAFAAMLLQWVPDILAIQWELGLSLRGLVQVGQLASFFLGWAFLVGLAFVPKRLVAWLTSGTPEMAGWLRKLWAGPVGRWFFKLAGIGLRKAKALPPADWQPTEVLLGRAAADLFEQLPQDQRARLGDVPEVIQDLECVATTLRTRRRDELASAIAEVGEAHGTARRDELVGELETLKAATEQRLTSAVTALENLRLDLVRLRAGVGHPDDLTGAIEEARAVGEVVDLELEAHREVGSLTERDA